MILRLALLLVAAAGLLASGCATQRAGDTAIDQALAASHRSAESRARDAQRHPAQTLQFFGLRADMTVVEVWPGGGWYTEILAPVLRDRGRLYAAHLDPASSEYARRTVDDFRAKLAARERAREPIVVIEVEDESRGSKTVTQMGSKGYTLDAAEPTTHGSIRLRFRAKD